MGLGLVGRKCGMTRVFENDGTSIPVTVIEVKPNLITQIKTQEKDGYTAVQVTTGTRKPTRVTKPLAGHYSKAKATAGTGLWEFDVDIGTNGEDTFTMGSELNVDLFKVGQYVDVRGITKGKGFAGVIKRYNFSSQDATHGNSLSHRAPGSIGQNQSPGKVFKGKKMAGHLGNAQRTIQNLQIVRVDRDRNLLLIRGAIPGADGNTVIIIPAVKKVSND